MRMQVELVEPPAGAAIGERLHVEGYDCSAPDEQLPPKKKIFEAVSLLPPPWSRAASYCCHLITALLLTACPRLA